MERRTTTLGVTLLAVSLAGAAPSPAQADFSASVTSGPLPLTVTFTELTPDPTDDAVWLFGQGPLAFDVGPVVEFTYTEPGTYDVTLTSFVGNPPQSTGIVKRGFIQVDPVPLDASFTWTFGIGGLPLEVQFTDTTSGSEPTAWNWDFGDGSTSTAQHPVHVYTEPGTYDVQLEAHYFGLSDVRTAPGAVNVVPVARLAEPLVQTIGSVGRHLLTPDLDGDGVDDLLATTLQSFSAADSRFITRLNTGDGTYGLTTTTILEVLIWDWDSGDLDGDGLGDVVYSRRVFDEQVRARLSQGTGAFAPPILHLTNGGLEESFVELFDADGDGVLDLLTHRRFHMAVSPGDGTGGFTAQGPELPIATDDANRMVETWDVDGDGHLDVVLASRPFSIGALTWQVGLNDGLGGFTSAATVPAAVDSVSSLSALVAGDYDGDGVLDAVIPLSNPLSLSGWHLQRARGDGSVLASTLPDDLLPIESGFGDHVAVDVDLDGVDDLFLENADVALGGLAFPDATQSVTSPLGFFESVVATDVDGNGTPDLLATDAAGDWMVITYLNLSVPPGWTDLGAALAGTNGDPALVGSGDLTAGATTTLALSNALPNALTAVFLGFTDARLAFKGGVLVPSPDEVLMGAFTDGQGELTLSAPWLPGIGPGFHTWWQVWIADPAGPKGAAASNALVSRT